jgi:hypothetical protein
MDLLGLDQPSLRSTTSMTSLGEISISGMESSEMNLQDIATGGVAPIAARESVFKYQMALKEDLVGTHTVLKMLIICCCMICYFAVHRNSKFYCVLRHLECEWPVPL